MKQNNRSASPTFLNMLWFFIPLGVSASLVTLSHVIINGTLARSANPERIISGYAIAMSLLSITERPAVLLRQTCSALVRDRISFRAMRVVAFCVFGAIMAVGLTISYLPLGRWLFGIMFGLQGEPLDNVLNVYRILMFVSIFSGLRCLYHGLIIRNGRTMWLTIGMMIRLIGMYALSQYFLMTGQVTSSTGAIIFLAGMMIEAAVAVWEGTMLLKKSTPESSPEATVTKPAGIFKFYRPLLLSSFIAIIIGPSLNAVLGKTSNPETAIAAFAIATSVMNLVISFFSYLHQIVLNYYQTSPERANRFVLVMSFIPTLLLAVLSYTEAGPWFLTHVIGANERLLDESLAALRVFMLLTLSFTWLDYCNGILMLRRQTKVMMGSQAANVSVTVLALGIFIIAAPGWNATVGALAQSLGTMAELAVVAIAVRRGRSEVKFGSSAAL
ncbi:multi antimicrobial extrusion protein MatE [Paenibacillus chartarius]|uniref:Multi antimicrobial extrusion protein MatE n=1 Tax=Paenibacillus chartarius TaxID=747481 RepID=A0ABV6DF17_9BACL